LADHRPRIEQLPTGNDTGRLDGKVAAITSSRHWTRPQGYVALRKAFDRGAG
jgi:hypothetical protein